jgi:hypothetical protein
MKRIIIVVLMVCSVSFAQQDTFYVAPNGNDTNSGTELAPWKTFQHACSNASPGAIVLLKAGIYNEKVTMNVAGNAAAGFITFQNYGSDVVKIDGTGKNGKQLLLIQNKNFIRLIGLEFQNNLNQSFGTGIWIQGAGRKIEIRNCTFHDMRAANGGGDAMAISVYGTSGTTPLSNIVIDSNHIYNCEPGHSEALTLNGNVDTFQVTNNLVHDVDNIGIDMIGGEGTSPNAITDLARNGICSGNVVYNCRSDYGGGYAAGIYVDGGENIIVEKNKIYQCDVGLEIGCENQGRVASKIYVRDNLIFNNDKRGIGFGGYNFPATGKVKNSFVLNNTCYYNDILNTDAGELVVEYAESCVVMNNIFFSTSQNKLMVTTVGNNKGNIFDYNVWNTPAESSAIIDFAGTVYATFSAYRNGTGQDAHSVFGNPFFVSSALPSPDVHILASSPAINAGDVNFTPANGETDFDGAARVQHARVDCGAYEVNLVAPDVPRNLSATVINNTIVLHWNPNTENNILRYRIYGATTIHPGTQIDSTSDSTIILNGIASGSTYYFRITAVNTNGLSGNFSNEVQISFGAKKKYRTIAATTSLAEKPAKVKFSKTGTILTLPNLATAIEYEFSKLGKNGKTFAGIEQTDKTFAKHRAWISFKKAPEFGKLFTAAHTQTGVAFPLDSMRDNEGNAGKKLSKLFKPQRTKYNNFAVEQCVLFRFNILASNDSVTPKGLGDLLLDTNCIFAGKQLEGKSLSAIATEVDTLMTLWESRGINQHSDYENLFAFSKNILERINKGFAVEFSALNYTIDTIKVKKEKKPYAIFLNGIKTAEALNIVTENAKQTEFVSLRKKLSPEFHLQNYPNPFNPLTTIGFEIPVVKGDKGVFVTLTVYSLLGQAVATLLSNEEMEAGTHAIQFDASHLSSGVYFYRLSVNNSAYSETKKLLLLK